MAALWHHPPDTREASRKVFQRRLLTPREAKAGTCPRSPNQSIPHIRRSQSTLLLCFLCWLLFNCIVTAWTKNTPAIASRPNPARSVKLRVQHADEQLLPLSRRFFGGAYIELDPGHSMQQPDHAPRESLRVGHTVAG